MSILTNFFIGLKTKKRRTPYDAESSSLLASVTSLLSDKFECFGTFRIVVTQPEYG